jgi:hypothetical protein
LGHDKRQPETDEEALHHVTAHGSCMCKKAAEEERVDDEKAAYHTVEYRKICVCSVHIIFPIGLAA